MGPHEIDPAVGGKIKLTIGDFSEQSTITAWIRRNTGVTRTDPGEDGSSTRWNICWRPATAGAPPAVRPQRIVSGDWGDEYVAMTGYGWNFYLHTLQQYVQHFTGKPGTYVYVQAPKPPADTDKWTMLAKGLG